MCRSVVLLISLFLMLAGCTAGNQKPMQLAPVDAASESELMAFYKGLHQVGVRLLVENAGEGGRANLQRFNALYFTGSEQQALQHLRMSLFADPFNVDSKAVAAQLESTDLFGLLGEHTDNEAVRRVTYGVHESLPDVSARVYDNEHYAVLLQRYNAQVNAEYQKTRQLYVPDLTQLPLLDDYYQPARPARTVAAPAVRATPSTPTADPVAQTPADSAPDASLDPEVTALIEEPGIDSDPVTVLAVPIDEPIEPEKPQPPTPQELYQQGHSVAAYRLLRKQAVSERDQQLYERLRESLVETPYREGVSHFHAQEVRDAIEKFQRVLSIEPEHQRARQYMDRAMRLEARLSDID
ncbi:hypothetical protein [Nitrincola iocasae]|uniref:Uncharacterized protein n=1 Tax=Nitrincola iocasae TaxID=2614693 RepID=A0A5J6LBC1_9GAMM|nr:hypothetical protein [Nitrincola iocasae]QEW05706.1 hypothetical protein F5I99_03945 [Nitrincola iocasae]